MPRRLRSPLSGKTTKKSGSFLLQGRPESNPRCRHHKSRIESLRVKKNYSERNSDSHAYPFHFSAVTNHQTIAYRERKKQKGEGKKPRSEVSRGWRLMCTAWFHNTVTSSSSLLLLLLLLLLLSSSSSSPLCRVFILIFLRQTMSLGNTVLQLFCCYYSWCLYR